MKFILSSIFLLLLAPCNHPKDTSRSKTTANNKVMIIYQPGACFGRCPEYILTIDGEKKISTFKSIKNTEKTGTFTKPVSDKELTDFVTAFENAKFNSLENEYLGNITDFPIKSISYTNNANTKTIKIRSGAPEVLNSIDRSLRQYAESTEDWKKSEEVENH